MNSKVFDAINRVQNGGSILFESKLFVKDLQNFFYTTSDCCDRGEIDYFSLAGCSFLSGDMLMGVHYSNQGVDNYLMFSSSSMFLPVEEMAVGTVQDGKVHLICEKVDMPGQIRFISFPQEFIGSNQDVMSHDSYQNSFLGSPNSVGMLSYEDAACLEKGLEAFENFQELLRRYEKEKSMEQESAKGMN
ncbi:MAG: hypothetical protein PUB18_02060 [bacterium]|nr:hypothetical protein [bacterium]